MNLLKARLRTNANSNTVSEPDENDLEKIANSLKPLTMDQIWYVITLSGKNPRELPCSTQDNNTYQPIFDQINEHLNRIDKKLKKIEKSIYSNKK